MSLVALFETYEQSMDKTAEYAFSNDKIICGKVQNKDDLYSKLIVPIELSFCLNKFYFRGMGDPLDGKTIDIVSTFDSKPHSTIESLVEEAQQYITKLNQNQEVKSYELQYIPLFYSFKHPPKFTFGEKLLALRWSFLAGNVARRRSLAFFTHSFRGLTEEECKEFEEIYLKVK